MGRLILGLATGMVITITWIKTAAPTAGPLTGGDKFMLILSATLATAWILAFWCERSRFGK